MKKKSKRKSGDQRWDELLKDPTPRPKLSAAGDEVLEDRRKFLAIIECSRARLKKEGGIPASEMRRRLKLRS